MTRRNVPYNELVPYADMREYLTYFAKYKTQSRATMSTTVYNLSYLSAQLKEMEIESLYDLSDTQLLMAHEILSTKRKWGASQVAAFNVAVNGLFKWLVKEKKTNPDFIRPKLPRLPAARLYTPEIITPDMLFRMRLMSGLPIAGAATVELLLSSGLRLTEYRELRANSLMFDQIPVDFSTGKPSRFVGGSILLNANLQQIKKQKSRIAFFSKIAATTLRRYMKDMGIKEGSNLPLFPFAKMHIYDWLAAIKEEVPELRGKAMERHVSKPMEVDELELDEDSPEFLKRMIEQTVDRSNTFITPDDPRFGKEFDARYKGLHPHRFRHTFTCFQYFRNYYGEQHSMDRLKVMLGHDDLDTTAIYLTQLMAIRSQAEWEKIHIGTHRDWMRCTTKRVPND